MKTLLGALVLLVSVGAWAAPGDVGVGYHLNIAANSHEMVVMTGGLGISDLRSTERGRLTFTDHVVEGYYRVNESGDFTHTQWVASGVRGFFVNGSHYYTPATVGSISDDGEIIYYNPAGPLYSSTRGLLRTFGTYALQGVDINDAGVYTWELYSWPIYTIYRSDQQLPIGQGWNARINNHGTVCWTGLYFGVKHPICDGEPVELNIPAPSKLYSLVRIDFMDITDDEIIVQPVWSTPFANATIVSQIVRLRVPN